MKKRLTALLATLMLGSVMVGCGNSDAGSGSAKDVQPSEIVQEVKENIEMRMTAPLEGEALKEIFFLNPDDIQEAAVEKGMINTGLETVAVVKAKEGKAEEVKKAFEKYLEGFNNAQLYPGEPEAVEAAQLKVIGDYVGLFLIPDAEEGQNNSQKALEIFENALK